MTNQSRLVIEVGVGHLVALGRKLGRVHSSNACSTTLAKLPSPGPLGKVTILNMDPTVDSLKMASNQKLSNHKVVDFHSISSGSFFRMLYPSCTYSLHSF